MNTNIEVLRELDELVEAARLLGVTQAKRGFGCHTDEDSRFERAMYESIDKHRAALEAALVDAARYRLLRKGAIEDVAVVRGLGAMDYGMSAVISTYSEEIDGDDLDTTIDAAIRAMKEQS